MDNKLSSKGFTLVELLVGIAVFALIAVSVYQLYMSSIKAVKASRLKVTAAALANEQFEIIRNLPYDDIGIISGIPNGSIPHIQTITRDNTEFQVTMTIRNIDDPFDGTISGTPNDTSPADYKLAEVEIACASYPDFTPLVLTTQVGPRGLETSSSNGALFVQVFDAVGQPVEGANVHIENNQASPSIIIDDVTNNSGLLQIVDAPPGVEAYEISVSKSGYSTDQTEQPGYSGNPNPAKPHATVVVQQLTQISFAIDHTSTLAISSVTDTCGAVPSVGFSISGTKIIGTGPDVLKYNATAATDGSGLNTLSGLEWDTYNIALNDATRQLAGIIPIFPFALNPGTTQDVKLVVAPKDPDSLLITVKDASTQLPLSGADVKLEKTGYSNTLATGRGFIRQTDWSGGGGQASYSDTAKFFDSDGNIEINDPAGELVLKKIFSDYEPSGELVSSAFDTGSVSDFHQILWQPQNQPADTGADSVRFQAAANNDNTTWNFLGPDGTAGTYYTLSDQNINSILNGNRYFRFKAYMQTASTTWTPAISDVSFTFTSSCVPPGQVIFNGLAAGSYNLTVTKSGYQTVAETVAISADWQSLEITMTP